MYQKVAFEDLLTNDTYKINSSGVTIFGKFDGFVKSHTLACFIDVVQVYDDIHYRMNLPGWFFPSCEFYRLVCEREMKQKYRDAFERRAVNQIVSHLIGHDGCYY
jgi:hypothetical protein